ncbi:hypothetical protein HOP50_04g33070 [Chloropicon primus]|uniref:CTLH domain-containing protein n=1 Tax=Chloropicon primus TaxID=1764295 RepID=A0A5B8MMA1_9CHLO|nr:hypothetical protein A3770_04p33030 [Chloropicon primus]UPQ99997.1 hypothetical protein HOP50_04g33070 [Chloropicon primus]|eukprot:QDZ20785.1 hypothetical protein A3770_04p33030 [Chloropicon primus]
MVTEERRRRGEEGAVVLDLRHLDGLVAECLEDLREPAACERARSEVLEGNIKSAIRLAQGESGGSSVLEDRRLLFKLYKEQFVELAQNASSVEDTQSALLWCRETLAPMALEAYPEAYSEFKQALLLATLSSCGVGREENVGSLSNRRALAGAICGALRKAAGATPPRLANVLRYLLLLHRRHRVAEGGKGKAEDVDVRLIESQDGPMLPAEGRVASSRTFPEGDVLLLRDAAGITREEAVEALRREDGDIDSAVSSELCRSRLREAELREILLEYAQYRGLRGGGETGASDYALVREIATAVVEGRAGAGVLSKIPQLAASPAFMFELRRFELLERLRRGDRDGALDIARSDLPDLVERDESLLRELKRTMMAFVTTTTTTTTTNATEDEVDAACDAILRALGWSPPRLICVLRVLLGSHRAWHEREMRRDRLQDALGLPDLVVARDGCCKEEGEVEDDESPFEEPAVLTLMDFLSSTRARAIELLRTHDGNLEQCLETVFG